LDGSFDSYFDRYICLFQCGFLIVCWVGLVNMFMRAWHFSN